MLAADDGVPGTMALMHELSIQWRAPDATPDAPAEVSPTMRPAIVAGYAARRRAAGRPATGRVPGRADIRLGLDASGELYILSKTDGMIRAVTRVSVTVRAGASEAR
jgi:hypothetical protein